MSGTWTGPKRLRWVTGAAVAALAAGLLSGCSDSGASDTVYFGVSGPRTGQSAEYGRLWQQGFDLALREVNAAGGINGKKVALKWEDSQSDPKQTVPIATKFVGDRSIIAELGDFSSPASIAASPVYNRGKLLQYGFTNSAADFTKGGDYSWSPSITQDVYQERNAQWVRQAGGRKVSVVYLETDWGKQSFGYFQKAAKDKGIDIAYSSPILPDSTDFRPILIKARDAAPDAVVHLGYGPDGALVIKQLRDVGFTGPFYGGQNTPQFIQLAGPAAEGDIISGIFSPSDPDPRVQEFTARFRSEFGTDPGDFNVYAYDAIQVLVKAARAGGATREGIVQGLRDVKDFSGIGLGPSFAFDQQSRRPSGVQPIELQLRDGRFVPAAAQGR
ncbi:ABC transporter substrate-binding protein [Nocardia mexicana]|uniref:Amino acid/amide ABC transporter substrate-binding protein (HAAT family) n=1 Tax=Nocardia mexicana TaxID=279262 RepID=A0A370H6W9_9NOCA|nr:ABC transporter substrate-binding protein [Nocardia mexicana]RDI52152.1 amino acid/amide ABC transporter substrate-binding protein (HAAT family) [Nocardia mexicana]